MSIRITCDKCGFSNDNLIQFGNKGFKILKDDGDLGIITIIHLCDKCREELMINLIRTTGEFLDMKLLGFPITF